MDEINYPSYPETKYGKINKEYGEYSVSEEGLKLVESINKMKFVSSAYMSDDGYTLTVNLKRPVLRHTAGPGGDDLSPEEIVAGMEERNIPEQFRGTILHPTGVVKDFTMTLDLRYFEKDHPYYTITRILLAGSKAAYSDQDEEDATSGWVPQAYMKLNAQGAFKFDARIPGKHVVGKDGARPSLYISPHFGTGTCGDNGFSLRSVCSQESAPLQMIEYGEILGFILSFYHVISKYSALDNLGFPGNNKNRWQTGSIPPSVMSYRAYTSEHERAATEAIISGMESISNMEIGVEDRPANTFQKTKAALHKHALLYDPVFTFNTNTANVTVAPNTGGGILANPNPITFTAQFTFDGEEGVLVEHDTEAEV